MRHRASPSPFSGRLAQPLLISALALASGCPDHITDPERFLDVNLGEGPVDETPVTSNCPMGATYVETTLLPGTCAIAGCHSSTSPQNGLDLSGSDDVLRTRLIGHMGSSACSHALWIDPADVSHSLILVKTMASPPCGSRMPIGATLTTVQTQCLTDWMQRLVAPASTDAGTDAGADASSAMDAGMDASQTDAARRDGSSGG